MFHPTALGSRQATISIANDDDSEHPYTFLVQGTGADPGPGVLVLDDSMPGFIASNNWSNNNNSGAMAGAYRSIPAGQGNEHSTWTFSGLAPGHYDVMATWVPFGN